MKIIDQTPFYKENGQLSFLDRFKAIMQFGTGWVNEIEAQKSVIAVLEKFLDKNYTLLRNFSPPGLEASIPIILVGPTGLYVMCVTPIRGNFRARGDQWGTISGNAFRPEHPNLLTRTEHMARAIHVFLQRQGYTGLAIIEAVLLISDPTTNVDSTRPIVRVIMRDTLERFAVSISQGRIVLDPAAVADIINRLLTPPATPPLPPKLLETAATSAITPPAQEDNPEVPWSTLPVTEPAPASEGFPASLLPEVEPETTPAAAPGPRPRWRLSRKQLAVLIGLFVIWFLIVIPFAFLVIKNIKP